jgi:hypothetical protein
MELSILRTRFAFSRRTGWPARTMGRIAKVVSTSV